MTHHHSKPSALSQITLLFVLATMLISTPVYAQTQLTEITPFSFGKFSLKNNDTPQTLSVDALTNTVSAGMEFVIDQPAQRGEYRLTGFTPGTEVYVTLQNGALKWNGAGATGFTIIDYTINPANLIADGTGRIDFYIGATLRTIGDGLNYPTGMYNDDLEIEFDWVE